jgi:hypothetical protein
VRAAGVGSGGVPWGGIGLTSSVALFAVSLPLASRAKKSTT